MTICHEGIFNDTASYLINRESLIVKPKGIGFLISDLRFLKILVRVKGLEPPRLAASDPKSDVSASFTTPAFLSKGLQK